MHELAGALKHTAPSASLAAIGTLFLCGNTFSLLVHLAKALFQKECSSILDF